MLSVPDCLFLFCFTGDVEYITVPTIKSENKMVDDVNNWKNMFFGKNPVINYQSGPNLAVTVFFVGIISYLCWVCCDAKQQVVMFQVFWELYAITQKKMQTV